MFELKTIFKNKLNPNFKGKMIIEIKKKYMFINPGLVY